MSNWLAVKLLLVARLPQWQAHSILLWAALVGGLGALVTVAFRETIHLVQWILTHQEGGLVKTAMALPPWQRMLVPTVGGLLAGGVLVVSRQVAHARSAPDYMEAIALGDGSIHARHTLLRSLSSALSVGSGASIGREGPMVQLAAMVASLLGRLAAFKQPRSRMLVACGAAAGIASAYNAPIAGALFVSEIVLGSIAMPAFGPLLVASVTAGVTTHQLLGYHPTYNMPVFEPITGFAILPFVGLGLVMGAGAPLFLAALDLGKRVFDRTGFALPLKMALGGLVVGLLSWQVPQVWGNGYSVVDSILSTEWTWRALMLVLLFKVLATTATVGSGAVGGVFTPTLFSGAALGALYAQGLQALLPGSVSASAGAAVGMGAMLAATTHAPLMAIIMISEMTMSYQLVLPLMLSCVVAYTVARLFRTDAVYSASLRRQRADAPQRPYAELRVSDLLKPDRPSIAPDTDLRTVAEAFAGHRVQYLYVTDARGRFLGAVSLHDLTRRMPDGQPARTARDILLTEFPRLDAEMDLAQALGVFARHHGERLPVVAPSKGFKLLGSASKTDLLFLMQEGLND